MKRDLIVLGVGTLLMLSLVFLIRWGCVQQHGEEMCADPSENGAWNRP